VLDETGSPTIETFPTIPAGSYTVTDLLVENFIPTCTAMFRRDALGELPPWFDNLKLGDLPVYALVAQKGDIELLDGFLAIYRMHARGAWTSRSQENKIRNILAMLTRLNRELGYKYDATIRKKKAKLYEEWSIIAWQSRSRVQAAACLAYAARNGGYNLEGARPALRGLAWYAIFGSWLPTLAKAKRTLLP
jgi:hypothetical protein